MYNIRKKESEESEQADIEREREEHSWRQLWNRVPRGSHVVTASLTFCACEA